MADIKLPKGFKRDCSTKCYFSLMEWLSDTYQLDGDLSQIDLDFFLNASSDPFLRESDINSDIITVVENFSALPDPTTVNGEFYWAESSQGTKYLPAGLGGTYYNAGLYYSNGVNWTFVEVPYQATQAEVDAGTNTDKFVTPATLLGNLKKYDLYFQFSTATDTDYIVPEAMSIESVTASDGGATITLEVNAAAYTLGDPISQYDTLNVATDTACLVTLEIEEV